MAISLGAGLSQSGGKIKGSGEWPKKGTSLAVKTAVAQTMKKTAVHDMCGRQSDLLRR